MTIITYQFLLILQMFEWKRVSDDFQLRMRPIGDLFWQKVSYEI